MATNASEDLVKKVVYSLTQRRFNFQNEKDLQDGIEQALKTDGFSFFREHSLGEAGIIDFWIGTSLGLEVKIKGSPSEVARQLLRYAGRDDVKAIMRVTGRAALSTLPTTLMGKPLTIVELWRTFL